MPHNSQNKVPFYIHIAYLFIALLLGFALLSGWNQYQATSVILKQSADRQFRLTAQAALEEVEGIYKSGALTTQLLAQQRLMYAKTLAERLDSLGFISTSLSNNPAVGAQFIGYDTGDFFMVSMYRGHAAIQKRFNPPNGTRWIVQSITHPAGQIRGEYLFYDDQLKLIEQRIDPNYQYDPRVRDWYKAKATPGQLIVGQPYYFASSGLVGITFSQQTSNQLAVAGSDLQLARINEFLLQHQVTPDTRLALLDHNERVIASHSGTPKLITEADGQSRLPKLFSYDAPVLKAFLNMPQGKADNASTFASEHGEAWEGLARTIQLPNMSQMQLVMAVPHRELLAAAIEERNRSLLMSLLLIVLGVLVAIWLARKASNPINALTEEIQKIEQFQFDDPVQVETNISEIARLASSLGDMKTTIHRFMELSQALAAESNFGRLLARILDELGAVSLAEGGVIYIHHDDGHYLEAAQYFWQSKAQTSPEHVATIDLNGEHIVAQALRNDEVLRSVSPDTFHHAFPLLPATEKNFTQLTLPLRNRDGTLVGALALLIDESRKPSADLLAFVQTIAATAAVAVDTQRLVNEQKILLEAFIQLIAGAIDAKSPYTGGHCQRVPELTKMLARAAQTQTTGPFADFVLSEEQWEELHIAAWLHDCGKVTTPEYVVDKATKLETLYDRIHEIRMRFEVLKRDAEIRCWQGIAEGGDANALKTQLAQELATLDDEFSFIATCNEGGELMAPEKLEKLKQIASRTWLRTLPDRIGIAHEEKERKAREAEAPLPVIEALLADKPEHILIRSERDKLAEDNPWGFKVKTPEHMYNRGELYNLSVARGTLSEEERYKINEHIIQTIIMLEKLPFPRHLRRVPEIAGGHHEKMDGTGYPKRLKRDEMSYPARMMAIADIFEALTAIDRPYKKGKTLSEAIKIMGFMIKDQHIDPEIFSLFLSEGLHLEYAQRFMQPEQIDEVDITPYLV
ncbi:MULTISPECIES: HD domain-containing phosphohydrolase [Deefgea]|uniref:GAF domain-containing protein n=1 Tax=Deefgea chitinilytica TaxID=570276 RepID=A0ABS2CG91_9NEIS|nr:MULTISPECIES: HD domain-containing phosphohydrolase [Deefgea]MBM5572725.1 GAF domain-containing protein [Deefgea chitinilytica]MBM9889961.1 GAF domain-containing protein [Deefgea sp. CFH1-16]